MEKIKNSIAYLLNLININKKPELNSFKKPSGYKNLNSTSYNK